MMSSGIMIFVAKLPSVLFALMATNWFKDGVAGGSSSKFVGIASGKTAKPGMSNFPSKCIALMISFFALNNHSC